MRPVAPRGRPRFTPRQAFQQFGDVVSCRLEREPRERGGQSKGYGFIEYNRRGVAAKVQQLARTLALAVAVALALALTQVQQLLTEP